MFTAVNSSLFLIFNCGEDEKYFRFKAVLCSSAISKHGATLKLLPGREYPCLRYPLIAIIVPRLHFSSVSTYFPVVVLRPWCGRARLYPEAQRVVVAGGAPAVLVDSWGCKLGSRYYLNSGSELCGKTHWAHLMRNSTAGGNIIFYFQPLKKSSV